MLDGGKLRLLLTISRYLPIILLLNISPFIRGCGDDGYSESIGFPIPAASIKKGLGDSAWEFPQDKMVITKHATAILAINISLLVIAAVLIATRFTQMSKVLVSVPFQMALLLLLAIYRFITPFNFFPGLILAIPIVLVYDMLGITPIHDDIIGDVVSRVVIVGCIISISMITKAILYSPRRNASPDVKPLQDLKKKQKA